MRKNEPNHLLRRIYLVVFKDDGTQSTDADAGAPAHSFSVTLNGAAPADASGSFVGDGTGEYYYEFTLTEVGFDGWAAFRVKRAGFQTTWSEPVWIGDPWMVGETDTSKLRQPVMVFDNSEPPAPAGPAVITVASQLQTALNSVSFGNAPGSLVFVADGLHYYQGTAGDAASEGRLAIRFAKAGFQQQLIWRSVDASDAGPPAIIPTPPAGGSTGLSFVPHLFGVSDAPATLGGNLDRLIDPSTNDFVRTIDGAFVETQDSRTAVLIAMSTELNASPLKPRSGTSIAQYMRDGLPMTPEFLQAETLRVFKTLRSAGIIDNPRVIVRDSQGRPLLTPDGKRNIQTEWEDLAAGSPIDQIITVG